MFKALVLILTIFYLGINPVFSQFYQTTSAGIRFFSSAPVEDIEAISNSGVSVYNAKNGTISFKVKIRSFEFEKALMQEHFNENYMESEQYPDASLKGMFVKNIDLDTTVPQELIIEGTLTVHGVSKQRKIPVLVKLSDDRKKMILESEFEVACKDHDIKIPKLLWENIAEVIKVNVESEFKIMNE